MPLTLAYAAFGFSYLLAITYLTARLEDDAGYSDGRAASVFALVGLATIVGGIVFAGLPSVIAAYIFQASDAVTYGPRYVVATLAFGGAQVSSPQVGGVLVRPLREALLDPAGRGPRPRAARRRLRRT